MPWKINPFTGRLDYYKTGSGSTSPAGSDREIQFNSDGSFGADAKLSFIDNYATSHAAIRIGANSTNGYLVGHSASASSDIAGSSVNIIAGNGDTNGNGGGVSIKTGEPGATSGIAGNISIEMGAGDSATSQVHINAKDADLLFTQNLGKLSIKDSGAYKGTIVAQGLSNDWEYSLPDNNGTFALVGDLAGYVPLVAAPASASSNGSPGMFAYDTNYIYICVGGDTWKRVAISTW